MTEMSIEQLKQLPTIGHMVKIENSYLDLAPLRDVQKNTLKFVNDSEDKHDSAQELLDLLELGESK